MSQRHSLIGTGLYSIPRAAAIVDANPRSVHRWMKGYSRRTSSGVVVSPPLWLLQYWDDEEIAADYTLGFKDLLELRTVSRLVKEGVSLQAVRATIAIAREHLGAYPLQSKRFLSDGRRIFMEAVGATERDRGLLDVQARQLVFDSVIRPSLFNDIEFDEGGQALRWFPMSKRREIVIDPARQFGQPIIESAGVPTDTIYMTYLAEKGDRDFVARIYRVAPHEVAAAVAFEKRVAA